MLGKGTCNLTIDFHPQKPTTLLEYLTSVFWAVTGQAKHQGSTNCQRISVHQTTDCRAPRPTVPRALPCQQRQELRTHPSSRLFQSGNTRVSHLLHIRRMALLPAWQQARTGLPLRKFRSIILVSGQYLEQWRHQQAFPVKQHQVSLTHSSSWRMVTNSSTPQTKLSQGRHMHCSLTAHSGSRSRSMDVQPGNPISTIRSHSRAGCQAFHSQERVRPGPPPVRGGLQSMRLGNRVAARQVSSRRRAPACQLSGHLRGASGAAARQVGRLTRSPT